MLSFPTSLPVDALSTGLNLIRNGEVASKPRTFTECGWNLAGFGAGLALRDANSTSSIPTLSENEKNDLAEFAAQARAMERGVHAQKLGDGKLLENLRGWLPLLLQMLPLFGIKLPV